jgi:MscS family membrane protein
MILGAVILGRIVYWLFSRTIKAATYRNKLRIDDVLLDALEEPVVMTLISALD